MRNNAQKHLRRGGFGGGGGTCGYENSQKYMDRFFGGATVSALACIVPEGLEEQYMSDDQGGMKFMFVLN